MVSLIIHRPLILRSLLLLEFETRAHRPHVASFVLASTLTSIVIINLASTDAQMTFPLRHMKTYSRQLSIAPLNSEASISRLPSAGTFPAPPFFAPDGLVSNLHKYLFFIELSFCDIRTFVSSNHSVKPANRVIQGQPSSLPLLAFRSIVSAIPSGLPNLLKLFPGKFHHEGPFMESLFCDFPVSTSLHHHAVFCDFNDISDHRAPTSLRLRSPNPPFNSHEPITCSHRDLVVDVCLP